MRNWWQARWPIPEAERKFRWPLGRRPDDHAGLSDCGL
jgi:nuclear transport factor 2 (NTF2) superfamily protein